MPIKPFNGHIYYRIQDIIKNDLITNQSSSNAEIMQRYLGVARVAKLATQVQYTIIAPHAVAYSGFWGGCPPPRPGNNMITSKIPGGMPPALTFSTFGNPPQTSPGYAPVMGIIIRENKNVCTYSEKITLQHKQVSSLAPSLVVPVVSY